MRYASAFLNRQIFLHPSLNQLTLPYDDHHNCTGAALDAKFYGLTNPYCRYSNGQSFLTERYARENTDVIFSGSGILDFEYNLGITFAFALGMIVLNLFLYLLPLPAFVKSKFRE